MKGFEDRHGIKLIELWGMTETSPLCTVAWPPSNVERDSAEYWHHRDTAGRLLPFVEARILDEAGHELPWDGEATGELQVRGPWIASSYFEDSSSSEKFDGQWLRTGDVAWIDRQAYMKVTDRAKDVIKSGGEWISSIELEAQLLTHPDVVEAAVIAMPHDKWAERPLACVVLAAGSSCDGAALRDHLSSRLPRWWLPDAFAFVDAIPKTSVGKLDKKVLRQRLQVGTLDGLVALAEAKA
jgi:fatty-acyl-CoA synthase